MAALNAWKKYLLVELKLFFRDWQNPFFVFFYPLLTMLVFGTIYGNVHLPGSTRYGFVDTAFGGYVGLVIVVDCNLTYALKLIAYRETRVYGSYANSPLSTWQVNSAVLLVNAAMAFLSVIVLLVAGLILFGLVVPNVPLLLLYTLLSVLSMYAFATMVVSIVRSSNLAHVVAYVLFFLMLFLSGATIPSAVMGATLHHVAYAIPLTYAVRLLTSLWMGGAANGRMDFLVLLCILVACAAATFGISRLRRSAVYGA